MAADTPASRIRAFLDAFTRVEQERALGYHNLIRENLTPAGPDLYRYDLLALLDERDDDVRAVVEACAGVVDGTMPQPIRHEYAVQRLRNRFADRITELEQRDAARATDAGDLDLA